MTLEEIKERETFEELRQIANPRGMDRDERMFESNASFVRNLNADVEREVERAFKTAAQASIAMAPHDVARSYIGACIYDAGMGAEFRENLLRRAYALLSENK